MEPIVLIDADRCVGCYMCQRACALAQCLEINELSRLAEVVRPEDCTGCGACERACPYDCIVVLNDGIDVASRAKVTLSRVRRYMNRHLVTVSPEVTVREGAKIMTERGVGSLLILEDRLKILTETDVLEAWSNRLEQESVGKLAKDAITVEGSATVEEALKIMVDRNIGHLPVTERGKVSGMLSIRDALRSLSTTSPVLREEAVAVNPKDIVKKYATPVPVVGEITNSEAYAVLKREGTKALLVRRDDSLGLLSIRDLTRAFGKGRDLRDPVEPRWGVTVLSGNEEISKALAMMMEHNLRHIPVKDGESWKILSVKEVAKQAVWVRGVTRVP